VWLTKRFGKINLPNSIFQANDSWWRMKVFCTYCSKNKSNVDVSMPAIERYDDKRITDLYSASQLLGYDFYILSGKYGLVHYSDSIDYYDHLLTDSEVEPHSKLVQAQLASSDITAITFFSVSTGIDPNVSAYIDCIKMAADRASIEFTLVTLPCSYT